MVDKKKEIKLEDGSQKPEVTLADSPTGTATDQPVETPESFREKNITLLLEKNPGADVSTPEKVDEAVFNLITRAFTIQDKLADVAEDEPEFAAALHEILKGGKTRTAFLRHYGAEAFAEPVDGDPDFEEYGKYSKERATKRKESDARKNTLAANGEISRKDIAAYLEEKGWTPEKANEFVERADKFYADGFDGKIMREHLDVLEKGFGYEDAVAEAGKTGEIAGLNKQIIEKKINKPEGDLMPDTPGSSGAAPIVKKKGLLEDLYEKS